MPYRLPYSEELFRQALAAHGPFEFHEPVPREIVAGYEGRVPDLMLDFWENHGIGELGGGLLKLCIPEMFAEPLALLLRDDPDFAQDTLALAYGPFGTLVLWNTREWLALVTHPGASVDTPFYRRETVALDANRVLFDYVLNADPKMMDLFDDTGDEMHDRAEASLGKLRPGLIYGQTGPDVAVESLAVQPATEWMADRFLGQTYMLHDLMGDRLNIRRIGAQA